MIPWQGIKSANTPGFFQFTAHFCENMATESDEELNEFMQQWEQQRGALGRRGHYRFELEPFRQRNARRYGIRRTSYHVRVQNPPEEFPQGHTNIIRAFEEGLADVIEQLTDNIPDHDRIQIYLSSNRLQSAHTSANVSVGDWRNPLSGARRILDQISAMLNSNENFEVDDTLHLDVTHITMPQPGSGKRKWTFGSTYHSDFLHKKKSVVQINNKDFLCCARALVTAKARVDQNPQYDNIRKGRLAQTIHAKALCEQAGVPQDQPTPLEAIPLFENVLREYQIVIVSEEHGHSIVHKGPDRDKQLILLSHDGHYEVITSLQGFFSKVYYCLKCEKGYNTDDISHHRCPGVKCWCCHQVDCPDFKLFHKQGPASIECHHCNRRFFGVVCQINHLTRTSSAQDANHQEENSVCCTHRKCTICGITYNLQKIKEHRCGENECPCCRQVCNLKQHQCYIQPIKSKDDEDESSTIFVYFDIEARQDTGNHVANLLCAETDRNNEQHTFWGEGCVSDFLQWCYLLSHEADVNQLVVVAHNFQGYDGYMVMEGLYKEHITQLHHIVNGAKILTLSIPNIKFIDSLNFLPMALAEFPKTFGLTELAKGFFPHFFNKRENQTYVGALPDKSYYDPQGMSPARQHEFERWYQEQVRQGTQFDFHQEILKYCQSDVRLLKQGCLEFQKHFKQVTGFNPMLKCITIAQACSVAYRRNWMPPNTIAVRPLHGWRPTFNQSHVAKEWLYWNEELLRRSSNSSSPPLVSTTTLGQPSTSASATQVEDTMELAHRPRGDTPRIVHAGNRGEYLVDHGPLRRFRVDGYDAATKTVYEFHGCFYHGCLVHFPNRLQRHPYHEGKTMGEVRQATATKMQQLRDLGYNVKECWECEWSIKKKMDPDIQIFVEELVLDKPLNPRDAFFGGRTNAVALHFKAEPHQEIRYVDVCSLYPWVNKTQMYPVGHPVIMDQPGHTDISQYFGFVKCKVLPPYDLYHGVLPHRQGNKLTFPLCKTCVETEQVKPLHQRSWYCRHSQEERALTGTWCTPELEQALEKGYRILYIFEVWHFPDKSDQLFKEYINTFLKVKQETSDWPDGCQTEEARQTYIDDYERHEGIRLDPTKIENNPGLRKVAKLKLNNFWGKFGQGENFTQVTTCTQPSEFFTLLCDDSQQIHRVEIINEDMIHVYHSSLDECIPIQTNTNIFVAAFTTCYARLKLYETLDQLQEQVLYFDTDSVVYYWEPGLPEVSLGPYLGQFTNEIKPVLLDEIEHEDYITEFVSAGPKNYAYKTYHGKTDCKVRGFTLNVRGQAVLNFNTMKELILNEILEPEPEPRLLPLHNPRKIQRVAEGKHIQTIPQTKNYRLVFDKRVLDRDTFQSYPYGYKPSCSL